MSILFARLVHYFVQAVIPWLQRYLFGTAIKQASKSALDKAPLHFEKPNLLLAGLSVLFLNGLNFVMMFMHTDSKTVPVITTLCVTAVTAFFLFRGFLSPRTKRERSVLLLIMLIFLAVSLYCYLAHDIKWLSFVSKMVLEVILCWAVMLSELHRLNQAQNIVVDKVMQTLHINPEKRIGKLFLKFGKVADGSLCAVTHGGSN